MKGINTSMTRVLIIKFGTERSLLFKLGTALLFLVLITSNSASVFARQPRQTIKAPYISLADHHMALVAYESCRDKMKQADFLIL